MTRLKPFVILDALLTLPLVAWWAYGTVKGSASEVFWGVLLVDLIFVAIIIFPSLICLLGKSISWIVAAFLILFYILLLFFLLLLALNQMHQEVSLAAIAIWLMIAKSIYGAVSVTRHAAS